MHSEAANGRGVIASIDSAAGPFSCSPVRCSSILQMSKWPDAAARCRAVSPACVRAWTSMNAPDEGGNQHAIERTAASLPVRGQ